MDFETRASTIYREALRTPRELRFAYLDTVCGTDRKLHSLVESLLSVSDSENEPESSEANDAPTVALGIGGGLSQNSNSGGRGFSSAAAPARVRADRGKRIRYTEDLSGEEIGPYELIKRVGKGGMGTVYAARRADQEFRKLVAVKLVKPEMESDEILQRFKHERQVLASLDHPNIARLLDGGTENGVPYLVLEFVEGTAIDVYCKSQRLSLQDKLNLFCTVCSAVQYAHQSLVIHRDLKPANIMVSTDGTPKLLDFGIAKVLNPDLTDQAAMTQASQRPMTPDYASPEQVRGEPVTTASDVYALGVLFYELLTTVHPLRAAYKAVGLHKAVLETDPDRPSDIVTKLDPEVLPEADRKRLSTTLRGDLDAIVMMCLRKEPGRRYASVQHLIDDIHRYQSGMPVRAHADSAGYRIRKFVRRHKGGVTAGALTAVALIASSMISWAYYHRANQERQRAEARFNDIRQFSRYVLFDFDNVLNSGITPARTALLEKASDYLDRLEKDRGRDSSIEQELVRSYLKIGDVRGNLFKANLGDREGARRSYEKAWSLLQQSKNPNPVLIAETKVRLADLLTQRNPKEALAMYDAALAALASGAAKKDAETLRALSEILPKVGTAETQAGMPDKALQSYDRSLRVIQDLSNLGQETPELRRLAARSSLRLGETRAKLGNTEGGLNEIRRAISSYQQLAADSPNSAIAQRAVATSSGVLGDVLLYRANRPAEAADAYRKALDVIEELADSDPRNSQYHRDLCTFLSRLGEALTAAGKTAEARIVTRRVLDILKPLVNTADPKVYDLHQYAWTLIKTTDPTLRNSADATRAAEKAVQLTSRGDASPMDVLARAYAATGQYARAADTEREALTLLPTGTNSDLREELTRKLHEFEAKR